MERYDWTKEETEHFLQVIKEENKTTDLDSKETETDKSRRHRSMETPANITCAQSKF